MKTAPKIAAVAAAVACTLAALPAAAQYANEFVPAKLVKQGTTSKAIAGSGTVVVQVQVNANGSHKAIKVIKSSNSGDNDAALDIAQNSSYRPARRGSRPIVAFYDFTLKFNGKSVARSAGTSPSGSLPAGSLSPAAAQVASLISAGQYAAAKSKAEAALLSAPGDESLRQMLGIAAYDGGDFETAAAAFDKVNAIGKKFQPIAAQSFAGAAVRVAAQDPAQALAYAQKAMSLDSGTNSKYALGAAQLANKQYQAAIVTLKSARDAAFADPKTPTNAKVAIDSSLMEAYVESNDSQDAQAMAAQVKQLDPTSTMPARVVGNGLLKAGVDAATAKNYEQALKDFDQAAAQGDSDVAVTADTQAAFVIGRMDKPDYKRMQAYADKALALKPNDAQANFAEGIALTGQAASNHDDATKKKALDTLNKADQLAKSDGDEGLALQIETFMKQNLNSAPAPAASGR